MRKICILVVLITIFMIFFSQNYKVSVEKIDLSLKENELGILFLNLDDSNSLLLSLDNINILYILNYTDNDDIEKYISPLSLKIDYVIMNSDYNVELGEKKVFDKYLYFNNIVFSKDEYITINYLDKTLCINPTVNNCDYVYYTHDINFNISNNTKLFFYNDSITDKYLNVVYNKWVDSYKISKNIYTILKIKDNYEILQIPKNI